MMYLRCCYKTVGACCCCEPGNTTLLVGKPGLGFSSLRPNHIP